MSVNLLCGVILMFFKPYFGPGCDTADAAVVVCRRHNWTEAMRWQALCLQYLLHDALLVGDRLRMTACCLQVAVSGQIARVF